MLKDYIELGETMDIEVDGVSTKTKVQEVLKNDLFTVLQPTVKLVPLMVKPDDIVRFTFYRPNGVYSFQAELVERISRENLRLYLFKVVSEIEKKQRRFGYRLPVILNATLRMIEDSMEAGDKSCEFRAKTINLSEKGILLSCYEQFERGTKLLIQLRLERNDQLILLAEVLRCEPPIQKNDPYTIAVQFYNCSKTDQMHIGRYILKRQIFERKVKELNGFNL